MHHKNLTVLMCWCHILKGFFKKENDSLSFCSGQNKVAEIMSWPYEEGGFHYTLNYRHKICIITQRTHCKPMVRSNTCQCKHEMHTKANLQKRGLRLTNNQTDNYALLLFNNIIMVVKRLSCTNNFVDKEIFALFPGCIFLFDYWCH